VSEREHIVEWDPPFYFVTKAGDLTIYGHRVGSPYAEDQGYLRGLEARGVIYTEAFSVACVEGELGSWALHHLTPISKEQFEEARARGWRTDGADFGIGRKAGRHPRRL
jgi:hypothetical protein